MNSTECDLGVVGLGVMGRNLLLNMADHDFSVIGFDKEPVKRQTLRAEAKMRRILAAETMKELAAGLRKPRVVMLLVPAGSPVDAVIAELVPLLAPGDTIIDGGNSYFKDTERRAAELRDRQISFLGVGISGGEQGARYGPSIMPGGPKEAYDRVRSIFESIAATAEGEPCVTYLGPGSAGHYVKMVHNGIEYGLMELIAETYHFMKQSMSLSNDRLHEIYAEWNTTELQSFLIEITAKILIQLDDRTGKYLVDVILDQAGQKGTGLWTSQEAMTLGVPLPTVDVAVVMRELSDLKQDRLSASRIPSSVERTFQGDQKTFLEHVRNALYAAMLVTYSQGMSLLQVASRAYHYNLKLEEVARIWLGGCIIRAGLLKDIEVAFRSNGALPNLLLDPTISQEIMIRQEYLRAFVEEAVRLAIPTPAMMVSLAYIDGYRSAWLPANLIQAQRDYFGAHSYERVDAAGVFHTEWRKE